MEEKTFKLVVAIIGGVSSISQAVVTFVAPPLAPAIVGAIGIFEVAAIEALTLFKKKTLIANKVADKVGSTDVVEK